MTQQMLCLVLLVIAVIAVIVVSVLLVQCHNSKGNTYTEPTHFCGTCQGLGQKVCTDRPALDRLYRDGTLNETSHLLRGNHWPVTMPADQFSKVRRNHESYMGEMATSSDPVCDYVKKYNGRCMYINSSISTHIASFPVSLKCQINVKLVSCDGTQLKIKILDGKLQGNPLNQQNWPNTGSKGWDSNSSILTLYRYKADDHGLQWSSNNNKSYFGTYSLPAPIGDVKLVSIDIEESLQNFLHISCSVSSPWTFGAWIKAMSNDAFKLVKCPT